MKKRNAKSFSKSLISASLRGLAVFLVFGAALYTYAVSYPVDQPNAVSGVVGLYVGRTTSTSDGNAGGYGAANAACNSQFEDSHICTAMEMINTYNHNPTAVTGETGVVWINTGPPAYTSAAPNDCKGWTANAPSPQEQFFGTSWNFDIDRGTATFCIVAQAFACCK